MVRTWPFICKRASPPGSSAHPCPRADPGLQLRAGAPSVHVSPQTQRQFGGESGIGVRSLSPALGPREQVPAPTLHLVIDKQSSGLHSGRLLPSGRRPSPLRRKGLCSRACDLHALIQTPSFPSSWCPCPRLTSTRRLPSWPPSPSPPESHLGGSLGRLWASRPPSSTGHRVASFPMVLSPGLRPGGLSDPGGLATSPELSNGRSPWPLPPNLPPPVGFRSTHPGPVTSAPLVRIDTAHVYTC